MCWWADKGEVDQKAWRFELDRFCSWARFGVSPAGFWVGPEFGLGLDWVAGSSVFGLGLG